MPDTEPVHFKDRWALLRRALELTYNHEHLPSAHAVPGLASRRAHVRNERLRHGANALLAGCGLSYLDAQEIVQAALDAAGGPEVDGTSHMVARLLARRLLVDLRADEATLTPQQRDVGRSGIAQWLTARETPPASGADVMTCAEEWVADHIARHIAAMAGDPLAVNARVAKRWGEHAATAVAGWLEQLSIALHDGPAAESWREMIIEPRIDRVANVPSGSMPHNAIPITVRLFPVLGREVGELLDGLKGLVGAPLRPRPASPAIRTLKGAELSQLGTICQPGQFFSVATRPLAEPRGDPGDVPLSHRHPARMYARYYAGPTGTRSIDFAPATEYIGVDTAGVGYPHLFNDHAFVDGMEILTRIMTSGLVEGNMDLEIRLVRSGPRTDRAKSDDRMNRGDAGTLLPGVLVEIHPHVRRAGLARVEITTDGSLTCAQDLPRIVRAAITGVRLEHPEGRVNVTLHPAGDSHHVVAAETSMAEVGVLVTAEPPALQAPHPTVGRARPRQPGRVDVGGIADGDTAPQRPGTVGALAALLRADPAIQAVDRVSPQLGS